MNQDCLTVPLNSTDVVIILLHSDGRVKFINQVGLDLLSLPLVMVEDHYFWEVASLAEQIEPITSHFEQILTAGNSKFTKDVPWKLTNGEVRWLHWTVSTVLHSDEQHTQILAIGTDITTLKRSTDELDSVKNRLQLALDIGNMSIWEIDIETGEFHFHHHERGSSVDQSLPNPNLHQMLELRFGPDREADIIGKVANFKEQAKRWSEGDKIIDNVRYSIQGLSQTVSPQWLQSNGRVIKNAHGRLSILGISSNITKQKQGEIELEEERAFSAALLNAIDTLVFVVDADSIIVHVNQACQTILGYSIQELQGVSFCKLINRLERRNEIQSKFASFLESSRSEFYQDQLISKRGELRWIRWRAAPIQLNNGETAKLVISGHDVTEEILRNKLVQESEARFQAMAANISNVLFIGDIDSPSIRYISPVYEHMFGLSCESLLADPSSFLSVVHPQDLEYVKTAFQQGPSYTSITGEYRILKTDNENRWVRYQTFPVLDTSNTPSQIIGMIEDITKEKQAYNSLHYQMQLASCVAELVRQLASATPSTIDEITNFCLAQIGICTQVDWCYLFNIEQSSKTLSCTHEWCGEGVRPRINTLQKLPFDLLSFMMTCSDTILNIPDTYAFTELSNLEKEIIQKIGIRSILSVPMNTQDFCVGFATIHGTRTWKPEEVVQLCLLADVIANTRLRIRAEAGLQNHAAQLEEHVALRTQELAHANRQLLQANRLKDEFLANISHELRTPLNTIMLKVDLMEEGIQGPLTKQQRYSLDVVKESSNHLLSMLADMLDLATSEVEMLSLDLSLVSLQKICEASMNEIRKLADKSKVRMVHNWPQTDIFVHGDAKRIKQILDHLLSNAVKFTPDGGDIGVDIAIDQQVDIVQLTVWDTGRGIEEEDLPLLFYPFVQLEGGLNRKYEGPGIGLALVKRLVLLHRGQISVKSQIGNGSRFIITLPYRLDQTKDQPSENIL